MLCILNRLIVSSFLIFHNSFSEEYFAQILRRHLKNNRQTLITWRQKQLRSQKGGVQTCTVWSRWVLIWDAANIPSSIEGGMSGLKVLLKSSSGRGSSPRALLFSLSSCLKQLVLKVTFIKIWNRDLTRFCRKASLAASCFCLATTYRLYLFISWFKLSTLPISCRRDFSSEPLKSTKNHETSPNAYKFNNVKTKLTRCQDLAVAAC